MYKIYASLLQNRLAAHFDHRLSPTQFGFRSGRSVTQPIHILRRLLEVHERQTEAFHAIFLDWAKAFDSVTFSSIQSSLEYMGVPPPFRAAVASLYQNPTFTVRESKHHSDVYTQTRGLRQGCPLSPYLFGFVLTHLFESAESQYVAEHGIISGPKSNNHQNVSTRISRAMEASKKLSPLMKHGLLPPNWKLLVYRSVVQSILMYAMDSLLLTPAQLTKMDSVHYKGLRRIFKIKSSYYHRVINPSSMPCSNQYLAELAFSSRRVISPTQLYSQNRLNLLCHLYRHPDLLEAQATFMPSAAYRHTRGANRVGRPKPHCGRSLAS